VQVYPSYPSWIADAGWTGFDVTENELEQQNESTRTSFGGSAGVGYGFFSFSANYKKDTKEERYQSKVNNLEIHMQVKRVSLTRPWLSGVLFRNRYWRFDPTKVNPAEYQLSDGGGTDQKPPQGSMTLIPTGFLLARKTLIAGLDAQEIKTYFESHEQAGGSVGWGPFAIGGNYSRDYNKSYRWAKNIGNGLQIDEPQIIGIYCDVLKKVPDPDQNQNLKWLSSSAVPK
jgi:hypothetical protein